MISIKALPDDFHEPGVAVSLGMFDGLHRGHLAVLDTMRERAGGLKTAVFTFSTDNYRPAAKTNLHLMTFEARNALLESFGIDYIIEPDFASIRDMSPEDFAKGFLLDRLHAKTVFCGENFHFGKKAAAGTGDLKRLLSGGAEFVAVPLLYDGGEAISTTRIRGLVQDGDVEQANRLLGRPFAISFAVEHGRKLGRIMGMPTINQAFPENFAVPRFGVYASVTAIGGREHISVTNVGVKPTVGSSHILAETYIHGFKGDLYGEKVPVKLIKFIRGEQKFGSVEELKAQIERDNKTALEMLGG